MTAPIWNRYAESAAERFGVPPALVNSVINVESGGRPGAVSGKGAGGYMQLMPDTFAELRQKHGLGPDRFDPQTNIDAGTAYIGQLYEQFGNWPDAVAAYNAGPNRWAQVKAGTRDAPRETQAYVPKVLAGFEQGKGADVPLNRSLMTEDQLLEMARNGQMPGQTGLLNVTPEDMSKDYLGGMGNLLNFGQTPSQPPRTDPAAMPGTTQTDRMDVSGRINELLADYMKQPQQRSSVSPLQYALGGMSGAVQPLAGVHDRQVGIGEMLGALGGGLTRGTMAGDEAQRAERANQIGELGTLGKIQQYQRSEAQTARQTAAAQALGQQLRAAGRTEEAQLLEANPSLIEKYAEQKFKAPDPFTVGKDEVRYDGNGRVVARGPAGTQDTTTQLSATEVAALGLPAGTVAQRDSKGAVAIIGKPPEPDNKPFDNATKLRTEFTTAAKPLIEMRQMYGRVEAAYKDTTPVGDIALTYGFMKMLDPTSVVREGEYATAQNAAGVPDRIRQQWNTLVDGNRLLPGVRDDMYKQAQAQYGTIEKQHGELEGRYRDLATRQGLDPANVVIDLRGGVKMDGATAPDPNDLKVGDLIRNKATGETKRWNGTSWEIAP